MLSKFRRRHNNDKGVASSTQSPGRSLSLSRLALAGAVGSFAIAATGLMFLVHRDHQAVRALEERQAQATAHQLANQLQAAVANRLEVVERVVSDPRLARLVAEDQKAALAQRVDELQALFPQALSVRVLEPGRNRPDEEASPPLGYACLHLLRQAELNEAPPAVEVHRYGQPGAHIDMARRIVSADGGRIVGHLLVTYPVALIDRHLPSLGEGQGARVIQQIDDGQPLALASTGTPGQAGQAGLTIPVERTRWHLSYWDTRAAAGPDFTSPYVLGVLAAVGVLILLLHWVLEGRVRKALQADWATAVSVAKHTAQRRLAPDYPVSLDDNRPGIEALVHVGRTSQVSAGRGERATLTQGGPSAAEEPVPEPFYEADGLGQGDGQAAEPGEVVPETVFRRYDIRGRAGSELSPGFAERLGKALGTEAYERGIRTAAVGCDGRTSSPALTQALISGLCETGLEVSDVGRVPTPLLYFATHILNAGLGVMVTGSHNPPDYNGFKMVMNGQPLFGDAIDKLRERVIANEFAEGRGKRHSVDVSKDYLKRLTGDIELARPLKVVVDCGNGIASELAPRALEQLGCEVKQLYCRVDGRFPNHHPDPSRPENLQDLIGVVEDQGADVGIAFDGDGDRIGVVSPDGRIVWPDRLLMLFAMDVLTRHPGATVVFDVKCTRELARVIREYGGHPVLWKTGHSLIKAKVSELDAPLGGELAGHVVFRDRWYGFDDAIYAAARLLQILAADPRPVNRVFRDLPDTVNTPELLVPLVDGEPARIVERLSQQAQFDDATLTKIDGIRADFTDGWGLVRASNTAPNLVLRFEARDAEALRRVQDLFRQQLKTAAPELELPF